MRLSCNFVNVHDSLSCVSTRTRVHARILNGLPREEERVRRTKVRRQVVRACPAPDELNGPRAPVGLPRAPRQAAGHADIRARSLARKSARKSVSVSVPWNLSLTQLATWAD